MARIPQRWECPKCGYSYQSPIQVLSVLCPKPHTRSRDMSLVEGTPHASKTNRTEPKKGKSSVSSGKV